MSRWTKIYLWIKGWKTPKWLVDEFDYLIEVFIGCIKEFSKSEIDFIKSEIHRQSKLDISGSQKLHNVRMAFRKHYQREELGDRAINLAIEFLVTYLTRRAFIGPEKDNG
jgi:hypothetical protein